jgi:hypothetical protein
MPPVSLLDVLLPIGAGCGWNPVGVHGFGSDDVRVHDLFEPDQVMLPVKAINSHDTPVLAPAGPDARNGRPAQPERTRQ